MCIRDSAYTGRASGRGSVRGESGIGFDPPVSSAAIEETYTKRHAPTASAASATVTLPFTIERSTASHVSPPPVARWRTDCAPANASSSDALTGETKSRWLEFYDGYL